MSTLWEMTMRVVAAFVLTLMSFAAVAFAQAPTTPQPAPISPAITETISKLQSEAGKSELAFEIVENLTTQIGPRLAGTPQEAVARDWAVKMLRGYGFQNVRIEKFDIPYWATLRDEAFAITAVGEQELTVAAIGGSGPTPPGGLTAEITRFTSLHEMVAADDARVRGKIVFIDEPTLKAMDGSGYGLGTIKRGLCAPNAQRKGAVACLIRSAGTHSHRFAHQGGNARGRDGATLPAASLSPPDADQLTRLLQRGPVRVRLSIDVEMKDGAQSGNVIAEIVGREKPDEIVLIGAHLDSWTQGTGALDDGAGVGIVTAAAKLIGALPRRPRRTIRVVLFGAEETGIHGATAYAKQHQAALGRHIVAAESDFGAGPVWRLETRFGPNGDTYALALHRALWPLNVVRGTEPATSGPDITPLRLAGVPVVELGQNGTDYFDYHHTPDDTLDKIDRAALRQNVQAWVTFAYLAAETGWDFRAP
jgi:Zn-dependent M28 family amino/carboxypeptidase